MFQAGIIEEMLDETMEDMEDTEEMEEEAQTEIDKVQFVSSIFKFCYLEYIVTDTIKYFFRFYGS